MRGNEANQRTKAPGPGPRAVSFSERGRRRPVGAFGLNQRALCWRCLAGGPTILPRRFPSRHGLGVSWTRVEDHPPEPPGLDRIASLLGQRSKVPQGEVSVDSLDDAAELVGTLHCCSGNTPERRGSLPMSLFPPRGFGFAGRNSVMSRFPFSDVPFSLLRPDDCPRYRVFFGKAGKPTEESCIIPHITRVSCFCPVDR